MDVEPSNDGNRPSNPAPSSLAPASSSGPVRSQPLEEFATLAEMADDDVEPESASSEQERAALAEMADLMEDASTVAALQELAPDEETVATPQDIVGPGTGCVALPQWVSLVRVPVGIPWAAPLPAAGGATPNEPIPPPRPLASLHASAPPPRVPTAPLSYLDRRMGALPRLHRHSARPVALPPAAPPVTSAPPVALPPAAPLITPPASPVALSTPPAAPPPLPAKSGIFMQRFCAFGEDESELHSVFAQLFTPKDPSTLPKSQWLSYTRLFSIVQPYAPGRVWKLGPGNLMQLLTKWCQQQPTFAGLARSEWCKRMKESGNGVQRDRSVYKFCLEYKLQYA